MNSSFFAYIGRMRYITRWALMRNTDSENVQEHSHMVAVLAHALAVIGQRICGREIDAGQVAVAALYHDASEILTGDMPTPIKYYNPEIKNSYRKVEAVANDKLLSLLPEELRADYEPVLKIADPEIHRLVKAADKLSAYIKCLEEETAGNTEFRTAKRTIEAALIRLMDELPEVKVFAEDFLPPYGRTLDELS